MCERMKMWGHLPLKQVSMKVRAKPRSAFFASWVRLSSRPSSSILFVLLALFFFFMSRIDPASLLRACCLCETIDWEGISGCITSSPCISFFRSFASFRVTVIVVPNREWRDEAVREYSSLRRFSASNNFESEFCVLYIYVRQRFNSNVKQTTWTSLTDNVEGLTPRKRR